MKIVVDTNVLLSSLLSASTGTLNRLLDQIRTSHTLVLSLAMAVERRAVIVRPKFAQDDQSSPHDRAGARIVASDKLILSPYDALN